MKLTIEIDMKDTLKGDEKAYELARLLHGVEQMVIDKTAFASMLYDTQGNYVGYAKLEDS